MFDGSGDSGGAILVKCGDGVDDSDDQALRKLNADCRVKVSDTFFAILTKLLLTHCNP